MKTFIKFLSPLDTRECKIREVSFHLSGGRLLPIPETKQEGLGEVI